MRTTVRAATLTSAIFLFALAACGKKKDDTAVVVDTGSGGTMTVAIDTTPIRVSDIQVGKSIGSDKKVANGTTTFGVRDTMYVAVITDGAAKDAKVDAKWTYNGRPVKSDSQTISPTGGENVTEFHVTKASAWPKGKYKVEVMLNGVSAGSKDLEVK